MTECKKISGRKWEVKDKIYISNVLIKSSYRLTVLEYHILIYILSTIKSKDTDFQVSRIYLEPLLKKIGVTKSSGYTNVIKAMDNLVNRPLIMSDNQHLRTMSWFLDVARRRRGVGWQDIELHPKLKNHLLCLKDVGNFTELETKYLWSLKNRYSFRVYMWLKQFQNFNKDVTHRTMQLERFLIMLRLRSFDHEKQPIQSKSTLYSAFKRSVLDPALKEINKKSDIYVTFEPIKKRRRVETLKFYFGKQKKFSDLDFFKDQVSFIRMYVKGKEGK